MPTSVHRSVTLVLIGIFKLLKAALLIAVSVAAFHLVNRNLAQTLEHWAHLLGLRPGNHYVQLAISKALNITPRKLELVGAVTSAYAIMFMVEGIGLLAGRRWAELMTIITTSGLLPLEIFEIYHRPNVWKIATLMINIAAVVYLIVRVRKMHAGPATAPPTEPAQPVV